MNNKPIFIIIAGTVFGSLVTTTSYAWEPPSQACLDARKDFGEVMCVIKSCKGFDSHGAWLCSEIPRPTATEMKEDCLAILQYECRSDFPDDPGGYCDPDALEPVPCPSAVGLWAVSLDTNCDGVGDVNRTMRHNSDFTWNGVGFPNGGGWTQKCCDIEMVDNFFAPPIIWNANMTNYGEQLSSGTYSGLFNGCWTATRINPTLSLSAALSSVSAPSGKDFYDDSIP